MGMSEGLRSLGVGLSFFLSFLLCSCGGSSSPPPPPPPQNPVPTIQTVSPASVPAGSSGFSLTVTGSGFLTSSVVSWNGASRQAALVNSSQLSIDVTSTDLSAAGTVTITITNPAPGGGQASGTFTISSPGTPAVASVSPSTVIVGGPSFTLTVTGSNFVSASVVQWGGVVQPTTYIDNGHLTAAIPASAITTSNVGNAPISVATPAPGGGNSNAMPVLVEYPLPSITSLSPNAVLVGSTSFTLTVNGSNFATGATVYVNSISRVTQFVSSTELMASMLASDITGPAGQVPITVENPPISVCRYFGCF
jgi:hypothetical protein